MTETTTKPKMSDAESRALGEKIGTIGARVALRGGLLYGLCRNARRDNVALTIAFAAVWVTTTRERKPATPIDPLADLLNNFADRAGKGRR